MPTMASRRAWRLTHPNSTELAPPLERHSQMAVFDWAKKCSGLWPCLHLLHSVPNEGKRSYATAKMLKAMGLKTDIPDIWLPVARGGFLGWVTELKREDEDPTDGQVAWLHALRAEGWQTHVFYNAPSTIESLQAYVSAPRTMIGHPVAVRS